MNVLFSPLMLTSVETRVVSSTFGTQTIADGATEAEAKLAASTNALQACQDALHDSETALAASTQTLEENIAAKTTLEQVGLVWS